MSWCPIKIASNFQIQPVCKKLRPGDVPNGVASTAEQHEWQVVLLHELNALGVTWNKKIPIGYDKKNKCYKLCQLHLENALARASNFTCLFCCFIR